MRLLQFPIQKQYGKEWCWLTAAVCIDLYYNPSSTWTQCLLANALLPQTTCCTNPLPDVCDKPGQLKSSIGLVRRLRTAVSSQILFSGIQSEIDSSPVGHPICVGLVWTDQEIGHAVIITGYDETTNYIYVSDPASGNVHYLPYDSFRTSYLGKGTWTDTFFTQP